MPPNVPPSDTVHNDISVNNNRDMSMPAEHSPTHTSNSEHTSVAQPRRSTRIRQPSSRLQDYYCDTRVDENQKFEGLRGEERETSSVKDASVLRSFGRRRHPCHYLGLAKQAFLKCLGLDSSSESESDNNVKQGKED
nr:uncharacterized protein LOC109191710 [Ipomoea trifida]